MNQKDLEMWLLDVAGEGGHSFRDFRDCIINNSDQMSEDDFLTSLRAIFSRGLIDVIHSPEANRVKKLTREQASEAIENYLEIVADNTLHRASYFIELSDKGRDFLSS